MAIKLNEPAVAALSMLADIEPGTYWFTYEPSYVSRVWAGFSPATLRSLVDRDLAEFKRGYERAYWVRITEDGRVALEHHRERTGFYTA